MLISFIGETTVPGVKQPTCRRISNGCVRRIEYTTLLAKEWFPYSCAEKVARLLGDLQLLQITNTLYRSNRLWYMHVALQILRILCVSSIAYIAYKVI